MSARLIRCLVLLMLPAAAAAQDLPAIYVSNTDICPALGREEPLLDTLAGAGARALGIAGIEGADHRCVFDPPLDLAAPDQTITTHLGYCEREGAITPQLFTFRVEQIDTARATLYDGSETPTVFFACPS